METSTHRLALVFAFRAVQDPFLSSFFCSLLIIQVLADLFLPLVKKIWSDAPPYYTYTLLLFGTLLPPLLFRTIVPEWQCCTSQFIYLYEILGQKAETSTIRMPRKAYSNLAHFDKQTVKINMCTQRNLKHIHLMRTKG